MFLIPRRNFYFTTCLCLSCSSLCTSGLRVCEWQNRISVRQYSMGRTPSNISPAVVWLASRGHVTDLFTATKVFFAIFFDSTLMWVMEEKKIFSPIALVIRDTYIIYLKFILFPFMCFLLKKYYYYKIKQTTV